MWITLGLSFGCILIGTALAFLVSRGVTRPLAAITNVAQSAANGNLEQQADVRSDDEIGILAGAFNQMMARLKHMLETERDQREHLQDKVKEYVAFMGEVGFAVVAAEVRSQAEQSRQATIQIKAILQDIQKATNTTLMATEEGTKVVEQGEQLADRTQQAIEQMSGVINESAQRAIQVVACGRQQSSGVEQISIAMRNINQVMMQSLTSTRQAEKAAQDLNPLAGKLNAILNTAQSQAPEIAQG